jgi:hypothetical protein
MEVKPKKTIRFDALTKSAGQPVQVTLWTKPEDDRDFTRATKEKRVATVIQHNVGTKKDYGLIGFYPQDRATYLVFPKSLGLPDETKIIGIKYENLASPEPQGAIYKPPIVRSPVRSSAKHSLKSLTKHPAKSHPKPHLSSPPALRILPREKPAAEAGSRAVHARPENRRIFSPKPAPPKLFTFQSKVQLKAIQTTAIDVEATSAKEAGRLIKERAEKLTIAPNQAKISRSITKPKKTS